MKKGWSPLCELLSVSSHSVVGTPARDHFSRFHSRGLERAGLVDYFEQGKILYYQQQLQTGGQIPTFTNYNYIQHHTRHMI